MSFHVDAPAKLNLFLNVVGRRADGYHEIDSLFAFVGLADRLHGERSPLSVSTVDPPRLDARDRWPVAIEGENTVAKAERLLREAAGGGPAMAFTLEKAIPVAAGLGGGSADAAAALRGLNVFWKLDWPMERLETIALRVGADVPACLRSAPVYARGVGEALTEAPAMPPCGILLANPRVATPTPAVFKAFRDLSPVVAPRGFPPMPTRFLDLAELVAAVAPRSNDLLPAAIAVTPAISVVLAALRALPTAVHVGLSGSGATCFGLFETETAAQEAEGVLRCARPGWWTWAGGWRRPA